MFAARHNRQIFSQVRLTRALVWFMVVRFVVDKPPLIAINFFVFFMIVSIRWFLRPAG